MSERRERKAPLRVPVGPLPDPWQLTDEGLGRCPLCLTEIRGEPRTFVNYWHPVEVCRDALVLRVRDLERRLRDAGQA